MIKYNISDSSLYKWERILEEYREEELSKEGLVYQNGIHNAY